MCLAPPEAPRKLEVSPITRDRPGFLLTWTPPDIPYSRLPTGRGSVIPSLPTGYVLEYRPAGADWKLLADLPAWQTSFETTKVEPGKLNLICLKAKLANNTE